MDLHPTKRQKISDDQLDQSNHILGGVDLDALPETISQKQISDLLDAADEV